MSFNPTWYGKHTLHTVPLNNTPDSLPFEAFLKANVEFPIDLHTLAAAADRKHSLNEEKSPITTTEALERNKYTSRRIHTLLDEVGRALHQVERIDLYKKSDTFVRLRDEYYYCTKKEEHCKEYVRFVTEHVTMNRKHMKRIFESILEQCTSDSVGMSVQRFRYNPFPDVGMIWESVSNTGVDIRDKIQTATLSLMQFGAFRSDEDQTQFDPFGPQTSYTIPNVDFTLDDIALCRVYDAVCSVMNTEQLEDVELRLENLNLENMPQYVGIHLYLRAVEGHSFDFKLDLMKKNHVFVQKTLLTYLKEDNHLHIDNLLHEIRLQREILANLESDESPRIQKTLEHHVL
jgi:hypothetical protein